MNERVLASRYARALAQTLRTEQEFDTLVRELELLSDLLESDSRLRATLTNPALAATRRAELVGDIISAAGLSDRAGRFLRLLDEHDRLGMIPDVAAAFREIRDERMGVVEAELTTAVPLDGDSPARWERALSKISGRTVRLKKKVDPSIIGGAVARIGSMVYDGSIRSRLAALRRQMIGG